MEDVLCDFVDAGDGKECSDVKIRGKSNYLLILEAGSKLEKDPNADSICIAQFEQDIVDVHCLHIMFCASADNGYARVLGPHRNTKNQITLVEGPPFAREIKELAYSFQTTSFPQVFRAQKLSKHISANSTNPTLTKHSHRHRHRHRHRHTHLKLRLSSTNLHLPLPRRYFSLLTFFSILLPNNTLGPKPKIQNQTIRAQKHPRPPGRHTNPLLNTSKHRDSQTAEILQPVSHPGLVFVWRGMYA